MHQSREPIEAPPPRAFRKHGPEIALGFAALGCVALAVVRLVHTVSFTVPLQLVTSGAEEEALASIWRFGHGQPVFTDPHAIPFTASYFNWFFYTLYGLAAEWVLVAFRLGDAWLPTVCRLFTLTLTGAGFVLLYFFLRRHGPSLSRSLALAFTALALLNPLCGFWIVTARPDIGAAVLELAGVACALRAAEGLRTRWAIAAALGFAAAWAFKQTSVGALAGIVLACVVRVPTLPRHRLGAYRTACVLIFLPLVGALVACAAWGQTYRHELYLSQANCGFHVSWAVLHLGSAILKMPFIAAALLGLILTWRHVRLDPTWRATSLVFLMSLLAGFAGASKGGAGDYYLISAGLWSTVWLALAVDRIGTAALRAFVVPACWQAGVVMAVLMGRLGILDPADPARPYEHLTAFLATRPGPVLVRDRYGDLPWISPTAPHFVMGFANEDDWRAGASFEAGGWRGLMQHGYFAVVVERLQDPFPPSTLTGYRHVRDEAGWSYFERR